MNTKINLKPEKLIGKYSCQLIKETIDNQTKSIDAVITVIDDKPFTDSMSSWINNPSSYVLANWVTDLENSTSDNNNPVTLKSSTTFVVKQGDDVVAGFFNLTEALFYYNNLC